MSTSGGAAGEVNAPPIEACDVAVGTGENPMIDDFEDGDDSTLAVDGREGGVYPYDDFSGGTLTLTVDELEGGRDESTRALHSVGSDFTEWGAGFSFVLHPENTDADGVTHNCQYDASVYEGLRFWARGQQGAAGVTLPVRVKLTMPAVIPISDGGTCAVEPCYDDHGVDFELSDEWREYTLPFADFTQAGWGGQRVGPFDPAKIWSIQFLTEQYVDFDYWIDDIGFYPKKP